jgi:UDP-N-acetylglucosamine 4,6-dehydratase
MNEVMVPMDDARNTVEFEDCYVIKPTFRFFSRRFCEEGSRPVPEDFEYNSGTNSQWLTIDKLKEMITTL